MPKHIAYKIPRSSHPSYFHLLFYLSLRFPILINAFSSSSSSSFFILLLLFFHPHLWAPFSLPNTKVPRFIVLIWAVTAGVFMLALLSCLVARLVCGNKGRSDTYNAHVQGDGYQLQYEPNTHTHTHTHTHTLSLSLTHTAPPAFYPR